MCDMSVRCTPWAKGCCSIHQVRCDSLNMPRSQPIRRICTLTGTEFEAAQEGRKEKKKDCDPWPVTATEIGILLLRTCTSTTAATTDHKEEPALQLRTYIHRHCAMKEDDLISRG